MKFILVFAALVCSGMGWADEIRNFSVRGVVQETKPAKSQLIVKHDEIPGYMDAMTMPFQVRDPKMIESTKTGDIITFQLHVTDQDHWIDGLKVVGTTAGESKPPSKKPVDIAPFKPGDPLPALTFVDERGQALRLEAYRGKALAINFIYTRCPLATFCPLLSAKFRAVQETLVGDAAGPKNWQLLSISIEPEHDTPEVLGRYAKTQQADPAHWRFATGDLREITVLGLRSGLEFWEGGSEITHNLRTVVFDAEGRMRKIFTENAWTPEDLAEEIRAGATVEK